MAGTLSLLRACASFYRYVDVVTKIITDSGQDFFHVHYNSGDLDNNNDY